MKSILITTIILMNILNLFGNKAEGQTDPYWEFNEKEHYRPQINKGDFFKLKDFDFGWLILERLVKHIKDMDQEVERAKSFSYAQKALYYWWYLDGQVRNGGFVQFYYNGYGPYVPTIIKGLKHIGDTEMAKLVKKADDIYQKNKALMDKAQESDLFGSDLYERLDNLSMLDDDYYEINENTMSLIEKYFRKHPNEVCLDEEGKEYDIAYSGICKSYYEDGNIKEEFYLQNGIINGLFQSFYENGNPKEKIDFFEGEKSGELKKYYENGTLKYEVNIDETGELFLHQWYHENGNPKKLESKLMDNDERYGDYKEWHENGQLAEIGYYIGNYDREGKWLEFYPDGSKKLEAKFVDGERLIENCWNEKGEQTLKNGTGLYVFEFSFSSGGDVDRNEQEYKNYKRHGIQKTFTNGILSSYQEMENGRKHGKSRDYYNNGNLKKESVYDGGYEMSSKEYPIFENPIVLTRIICEMKDEWLVNRELETADTYPIPLNADELAEQFEVSTTLFEGYSQDKELSYTYFVYIDETGKVTKHDFLVADNGFITDEVQENIQKMTFTPAQKDGINVSSYLIIKHKLNLGE